jgi:hypothetical protein
MANWETITVADAITKIADDNFVLPVIQRRLVWNEEKMELLFDTLLKGNSFGGIMVIEEEKDTKPLFAIRSFSKDGSVISSISVEKLPQNHYFIIDGQQRFQTFYMGIMGSINNKIMYFDLFSDYLNLEFDFEFENDESKLSKECPDRGEGSIQERCWYPVKSLFKQLKDTYDDDQVTDKIIAAKEIKDDRRKTLIRKNVRAFYNNIFTAKNIGFAKILVNKTLDEVSNRQRIVELFRRLNDGGTKLSSFDLVASILKGFEWKMEAFLDETLKDYQDVSMTQDTLIKLIFLLRDNHRKEMTNIEADDANFAVANKDRISAALVALKKFLIASRLFNYYREENRSFIPLYFVAYHLFHKEIETKAIENYFDTHDTNNIDYKNIYVWIYLSLLNGVFSKGKGWIPYKTGIRKILETIRYSKGKEFPNDKLSQVYQKHPVQFHVTFNEFNINSLDMSFLFYILYDRDRIIRQQDIDHIHPKSLLEGKYEYQMINRIENYQLLDSGTNRGLKNAKPLKDWILTDVENKEIYLNKHLIPHSEELWETDNYTAFLEERRKLIIDKINSMLCK